MKTINPYKNKYILAGIIAGIGCLIMVAFPSIALAAAQKGVSLWASSVLPALLPFFICANFMTASGIPALIGRLFERPFRQLFGAPGASAFVFSISITSGYPMGAKLIGDMGRRQEITKSEAKRMLTFCSTSGPLFMLGAVGAGMLGSPSAGAVIAIAHYLGAIENGILYRLFSRSDHEKKIYSIAGSKRIQTGASVSSHFTQEKRQPAKMPKESILELFTDAIISSFKALGIICGYIVLFTLITDFLQFSGLLNGISSLAGKGIIRGFFEMTIGCNNLAALPDLSMTAKCIFCSAIISWGGLSILAQSLSMLSGLKINPLYYVWTKITHCLLTAITAFLISPVILNMNLATTGNFSQEEAIKSLGYAHQFIFSTKMVIMVAVIFLILVWIENKLQKHQRKKKKTHESTGNHSGI